MAEDKDVATLTRLGCSFIMRHPASERLKISRLVVAFNVSNDRCQHAEFIDYQTELFNKRAGIFQCRNIRTRRLRAACFKKTRARAQPAPAVPESSAYNNKGEYQPKS